MSESVLSRLNDDEEGSSLVFAAITLFALALSIMFVYQIGLVSTDRIQIQNAADAAAYSAAQVEANALNSIGQINDAMAYLNYLNLRFTVDAIVYDTLHAFEQHNRPPATGAQGYVLMGGSGPPYEGPERFKHAQKVATGKPLREGKNWVQDLHLAARAIVKETPLLARKTAAAAAQYNGAERMAFSQDLEKAFVVGTSDDDGFGERTSTTSGNTFEDSMFMRYGRDNTKVWQVDTAAPPPAQASAGKQGLPNSTGGWFDPKTGRLMPGSRYSQVRLCWNENDWIHEGHTPQHGTLLPYSQFREGAPNGHWHGEHSHWHFDGITFTELGPHAGITGKTDNPGGHWLPQDDDPTIHNEATDLQILGPLGAHHYVKNCYTCNGRFFSPGASWSEVRKTTDDARSLRGFHKLSYTRVFPRPLMMRESLLRSGITVVTWRKARDLGNTFPASDWGMLAIASAAVGYQIKGGGVLALEAGAPPTAKYKTKLGGTVETRDVPVIAGGGGNDRDYRNLFYSDDPSLGVRFGARLVPIAWKNTTHPSLTFNSLKDLLDGSRWYDVSNATTAVAAPLGLAKLKDVVQVDSQPALEAFWH